MNNVKHKYGKYVDINGDRYLDKPDPDDFIERNMFRLQDYQ